MLSGHSAGSSRATAPSPAQGQSRGQPGHKHRVPWGEKWGWGHPPNSWAGRAPSLASSKATLATCLLTASNKQHIPGASPAGERQKGTLGGLRSSSEVGGKLLPCCLKFHHLKYHPLPALSCWSHSTLSAHHASTKARAALVLKSQGHLAGLGKTWGQIPYKN